MDNTIVSMKNLAMVFLFLVMLCALFLSVYDVVINTPIPPFVASVLGSGIGYCITVLGLNHGIDVVNGTIKDTVSGALLANSKQSDKINS
jgi:hypothetical protein